jgi:hypothetical protein
MWAILSQPVPPHYPFFRGIVLGLGGMSSNSTCNTAGHSGLRCCQAKECDTHLSVEEHETLRLELAHGHSLWTIATLSRRTFSTVSREHACKGTRRLFSNFPTS